MLSWREGHRELFVPPSRQSGEIRRQRSSSGSSPRMDQTAYAERDPAPPHCPAMAQVNTFRKRRRSARDSSIDRRSESPELTRCDYEEPRPVEQRLLSPEQAAAYLGLRSRFAVYRLVASRQLPALRLANKLRVDLRDLDAMIENAKAGGISRPIHPSGRRVPHPVPRQLAPRRGRRRRSVTVSVTVPPGSA